MTWIDNLRILISRRQPVPPPGPLRGALIETMEKRVLLSADLPGLDITAPTAHELEPQKLEALMQVLARSISPAHDTPVANESEQGHGDVPVPDSSIEAVTRLHQDHLAALNTLLSRLDLHDHNYGLVAHTNGLEIAADVQSPREIRIDPDLPVDSRTNSHTLEEQASGLTDLLAAVNLSDAWHSDRWEQANSTLHPAGPWSSGELQLVLRARSQLSDAGGAELRPMFENSGPVTDLSASFVTASTTAPRQEILFISANVIDYQQLLDGISPNVEVYVLDPDRDGIEQMAEILAGRTGIDAIHLVTHGGQGALYVGTASLTADSMRGEYADELSVIRQSLSSEADLLIYGCNFGQGLPGAEAVMLLAELTGADVAASIDATGHQLLGGNWDLESRSGPVATEVAFSEGFQNQWVSLLPTYQQFTNHTSENEIKSGQDWGQTFTHTSGTGTYTVNEISLALRRDSGAPNQTVTVTLRSGGWNGTIIGTATIASSSLTTSLVFVDLAIPDVTLNDGTTYTIRVSTNTTSGQVYTGFNSAGGYTGGNMLSSTGSALSGEDMGFKVGYVSINSAPVLDNTKSPVLSAINEDAGAPSGAVGTLVSALVDFASPSGQVDNVTDSDSGALLGIAITAANTTNGTWWYSANGGTNWNALGAVSISSARLLAADNDNRLYFQPGANYNGTMAAALTFHAWDRSGSETDGSLSTIVRTDTVLDTVSSASYSNNNGTVNWASSWVEVDAGGSGPTSGDIDITSGYMRFKPVTIGNSMTRQVNLTGASSATFTFEMPFNSLGSGQVLVQVSNNGGSSFTTLDTFTSSTALGTHTYDISGYISSNTQIRFYASATNASGMRIDDVQIEYDVLGGGKSPFSTASDTISLTVNPVADTPSITNATTNEDTQSSSGLVISRNAADGSEVTHFKVTGITNGTLYKNDGTTQITDGSFITFAEGNAGLKFTPATNFNGSGSFVAQGSTSNGDAGLGGSTVSAAITVSAINDAPVMSATDGTTLAYTENGAATIISASVALADVDDTNLESAVVQFTGNYADGQDVLAFTNQNGISGSWNAATGTLTLTGSAPVAQYQTALRSVTYINTSELPNTTNRTVSFTVNDGSVDSNTQARTVSVASVNDNPANAGSLPSDISVTEDVASNVDLSTLTLADVDHNGGNLTVTLATSTGGNLTATTGGGVTVAGTGSATITLTGTLAALNTYLDTASNVQYLHSTAHTNGNNADTIAVSVTDNGNTGAGGGGSISLGSVNVDISAVNDAPVLILPGLQFTNLNTNVVFSVANGNVISVSDIDSATLTGQLTLTVTQGALTLNGTTGLTFANGDGTADSTMTFSGTFANINTALNGLVYNPVDTFNGTALFSISFSDLGGTGSGGAQVTSDAFGINVGSSQALWFSTTNNVSNSGVPGLQNWTRSEILAFSDPNLALEPGTTNGTVSSVFDPDDFTANNINTNGLHYVNVNVTVGTSTPFNLLAGDVLFSTKDTVTLTSNNSLSVQKEDIVVFRPNAPGDYSAGTFFLLLDNPLGAEIRGIALVESNTVVGDVTLTAGTLLLSRSGASEDGNIYRYVATDTGVSTAGTTSLLVKDSDIGIDAKVYGIELIQRPTTIGGVSLNAGEILLVLDGNDSGIGTNNLSVTPHDVFRLNFTQTTLGSGTAVATATLLLQGSDMGLSSADEELDAIALVSTNKAPVISTSGTTLAYTENQSATAVDNGLVLTDDSNAIHGAAVTISSGYANGQDVLAFTNQNGISGSWNAGTGTLTLTGTATVAQYQTALRSVTYVNTSELPNTSNRTVGFTVNDGSIDSNTQTRTVSVASVNDNPANAGSLPTDITVTEDVISNVDLSTLTLADVDHNGGNLTVTLATSTGGNLTATTGGGVTVAGTGSATITLTGTLAALNTYLDTASNVQYLHGTAHTNGNNVDTIAVSVTDNGNTGTGGGGSISLGSVNVDITAVNDAPAGTNATVSTNEDTDLVFTTAHFGFSDPVEGHSLAAVVLTTVPATGTLYLDNDFDGTIDGGEALANGSVVTAADITAGRLKYKPLADANGVPHTSFTFQVRDTGGTTNGGVDTDASANTMTINVTPVNDAPVRTAGSVGNLTVLEDSGFTSLGFGSLSYGSGGGADESGQTLSYQVTSIPGASFGKVYLADGITEATLSTFYTLTEIRGMQFKPTGNASGVSAFQFNVIDSGGTANGGTDNFSEFVLLTVTAVNDAPTLTAAALNPTFAEAGGLGTQAAPVNVFSSAAAATIESEQRITGLTFTVSGLLDGANEVIVVDGRTITLGTNSSGTTVTNGLTYSSTVSGGTATILLSAGSLTTASTQTLVNGITYQNTGTDNPSVGNRAFTLTEVKDNGGTANGGSDTTTLSIVSTVAVSPTNDQATFTSLNGTPTFTEGGSAVVLDSNVTISDAELSAANNFSGATLTLVRNGGASAQDIYSGTGTLSTLTQGASLVVGGTTVGTVTTNSSGTLVLTFNANATNALVNSVMQQITYTNNSDAPPASAQIDWTFNDGNTGAQGTGGALTATGSTTVNITAINDAPVISAIEGTTLAYTENGSATAVSSTLSLADVDDTNLESAVVQITGNYANGQDVLAFTNQNGISGSWDAGTGTLTLTGSATVAQYQTALRSVTYVNTSELPNTTNRTVGFTVNDGSVDSNTQTRTVSVASVNDNPANAGSLPSDISVIEDVASNVDLSTLTLADVDHNGGNLTVTLATSTGGNLTATSGGGVTIVGTGSATITLTGTLAALNTYLDTASNVQYLHGTANTNANNVDTVAVSVTDNGNSATGGGGSVSFGTVNVDITAVNDAPVISAIEGTTLAYTENGAATAITSTLALTDVDDINLESAVVQITGNYASGQDVLAFTNQNGISGSWSAATGALTLTGSATVAQYQTALRSVTYVNTSELPNTTNRTVGFTVNDGSVDSNTQTRTVSVASVNDNPANAGSLPTDITVTEDVISNVDLSTLTLADVDHNGGNLTVTLATSTGGNLTATTGGGVTIAGSGTGSITLTGTLAALNTYLDTASNVQYLHGTANTNGNNVDTVAVSVTDNGNTGSGGGGSISLGSVNVDISAVNDEQVITTNTGTTVAEGSSSNVITGVMLATTDVDNTTTQLLYTVDATPANGTLRKSGTALAVNDTFTQADINAGLITYDHNGSQTSNDSFNFTVDDGAGTASSATFNWTVTNVNDAPVMASIEGTTLAYTENGAATVITSTLVLTDVDDTNLESAVVQITGNYANGQDVLAFTNQNGISGSWSAATGTLTLTGSATVAQYQTALRSVTYVNTSELPSTANRTVGFTVNDGSVDSNTQTRTVSVTSVNDNPANAGSLPTDITVTEDVISNVDLSTLTLADVDHNGGNLTVTLATSTGGNLTATSGGGVTIVGSGTGSITLTGTLAALNTYLDTASNVQYLHSTAHTNGNNADTIAVSVTDNGNTGSGGGGSISLGSVNVGITAVNDEPMGTVVISGIIEEDQLLTVDTSGIVDHDGLGAFEYSWERNGTAIPGATSVQYLTTDADVGTELRAAVTWRDNDGTVESLVSGNVGPVINRNDLPSGLPVITGSLQEGQTLGVDTSAITDVDGIGQISYQWLRDGINIAGADDASYVLDDVDAGALMSVQVRYIDGHGSLETLNSAEVAFSTVNDTPVGTPVITGEPRVRETLFADTSAITDQDGLGTFTYQWQRNGEDIAGANRSFHDITLEDEGATLRVLVRYTDQQGSAETLMSAATETVMLPPDTTRVADAPITDIITAKPDQPTDFIPDEANEDGLDESEDTSGTAADNTSTLTTEDDAEVAPQPIAPQLGTPTLGKLIDPDREVDAVLQRQIQTGAGDGVRLSAGALTLLRDALLQPGQVTLDEITSLLDQLDNDTDRAESTEIIRQAISDAMEDNQDRAELWADVSGGISLSLAVGVVQWALRSGALALSFASTVPMWRFIDPLPVYANSHRAAGQDRLHKQPQEQAADDNPAVGTTTPPAEDVVENFFDRNNVQS